MVSSLYGKIVFPTICKSPSKKLDTIEKKIHHLRLIYRCRHVPHPSFRNELNEWPTLHQFPTQTWVTQWRQRIKRIKQVYRGKWNGDVLFFHWWLADTEKIFCEYLQVAIEEIHHLFNDRFLSYQRVTHVRSVCDTNMGNPVKLYENVQHFPSSKEFPNISSELLWFKITANCDLPKTSHQFVNQSGARVKTNLWLVYWHIRALFASCRYFCRFLIGSFSFLFPLYLFRMRTFSKLATDLTRELQL